MNNNGTHEFTFKSFNLVVQRSSRVPGIWRRVILASDQDQLSGLLMVAQQVKDFGILHVKQVHVVRPVECFHHKRIFRLSLLHILQRHVAVAAQTADGIILKEEKTSANCRFPQNTTIRR